MKKAVFYSITSILMLIATTNQSQAQLVNGKFVFEGGGEVVVLSEAILPAHFGLGKVCVVSGYFFDSIVVNDSTHFSQGGKDGFLVVYNSTTNDVSFYQIGGTGDDVINDVGFGFSQPGILNINAGGSYENTILTGLQGLPYSVTTTSIGGKDGFFIELSPIIPANLIHGIMSFWQYGGTGNDEVKCISTIGFGHILVMGEFENDISFLPNNGGAPSIQSFGGKDVFFHHFGNSGFYGTGPIAPGTAVLESFGSYADDLIKDIVTKGGSSQYAIGDFSGSLHYSGQQTIGGLLQSTGGSRDVFLLKFDSWSPIFNFMWGKSFGGQGDETGISGNGNYFQGFPDDTSLIINYSYDDVVQHNINGSTKSYTPMGGRDVNSIKLDTGGAVLDVLQFKSVNDLNNLHTMESQNKEVYFVGDFLDALEVFDRDGNSIAGTLSGSTTKNRTFFGKVSADFNTVSCLNAFDGAGIHAVRDIDVDGNNAVITGNFTNDIEVGTVTLDDKGAGQNSYIVSLECCNGQPFDNYAVIQNSNFSYDVKDRYRNGKGEIIASSAIGLGSLSVNGITYNLGSKYRLCVNKMQNGQITDFYHFDIEPYHNSHSIAVDTTTGKIFVLTQFGDTAIIGGDTFYAPLHKNGALLFCIDGPSSNVNQGVVWVKYITGSFNGVSVGDMDFSYPSNNLVVIFRSNSPWIYVKDNSGQIVISGQQGQMIALGKILSFSPSGVLNWHKSYGSSNAFKLGKVLCHPSSPEVFITGEFMNNFQTQSFSTGTYPGVTAFVAKYDMNGNDLWLNYVQTQLSNFGAMYVNDSNQLVLAGSYDNRFTFGLSNHSFSLPIKSTGSNLFVIKYKNNGDFVIYQEIGEVNYFGNPNFFSFDGIAISDFLDMNGTIAFTGKVIRYSSYTIGGIPFPASNYTSNFVGFMDKNGAVNCVGASSGPGYMSPNPALENHYHSQKVMMHAEYSGTQQFGSVFFPPSVSQSFKITYTCCD